MHPTQRQKHTWGAADCFFWSETLAWTLICISLHLYQVLSCSDEMRSKLLEIRFYKDLVHHILRTMIVLKEILSCQILLVLFPLVYA